MKAGPLWRGVSIALSDTLTCMAAPSWGWPTATFLRVGLRSRGPNKDQTTGEIRRTQETDAAIADAVRQRNDDADAPQNGAREATLYSTKSLETCVGTRSMSGGRRQGAI